MMDALERQLRAWASGYLRSDEGREVHSAWRDGMRAQRREVAPNRLRWETLEERDRLLDGEIAERVLGDFLGWIEGQRAHDAQALAAYLAPRPKRSRRRKVAGEVTPAQVVAELEAFLERAKKR